MSETETTAPKKAKMTADDLKGVYSVKLGVPKERVIIHKNAQLGWTATLITHQPDRNRGVELVEQLTRSLRMIYELKD